MESRSDIYYSRNTVKPPKPGRKRRDKVKKQKSRFVINNRRPKYEEKVCLTQKCVWCEREFTQYFAVCPYCHNCQYCGQSNDELFKCQQCANHVDEENNKVTIFRAI